MDIINQMTANALSWRILICLIKMTRLTDDVLMFSFQRETRVFMIEMGLLPNGLLMTAGTIRA
jgi:hypothetical protein